MSNANIPSVSLQTAVLMQIQELIASGQGFSRYDITKALRQKCNDGLLEIPEIENVNPGSIRFNVRKASVDAIFEQLYANLLQNGLPALRYDFNRDPQSGVGFRVFSVDNSAAPVATPAPAAPPVVNPPPPTITPISDLLKTLGVDPNAPSAARDAGAAAGAHLRNALVATPLDDTEIRRRATVYLQNCQKIGKVPTLKNIQSALKRKTTTGLSRKECFNLAKSLGFRV